MTYQATPGRVPWSTPCQPAPPAVVEPPALFVSSPIGAGEFPELQPLRVLVVDDNRDAADTLAAVLEASGAEVRVCYDGESAAREALGFRPDVGLFDINMPEVDGCELARRVRAEAGWRPVLLAAVTGVSGQMAECRTTRSGFNLHITKPVDPAALLATLAGFAGWLHSKSAPAGG